MVRFLLSLTLASAWAVCSATMLLAAEPNPGNKGLANAVDDLESQRFSVRESATRKLHAAGNDAIPLLKSAIAKGGLETISRCLGILHHFHLNADAELSDASLNVIRELQDLSSHDSSPRTVMAIRHQWVKWERAAKTLLAKRGAQPSGSDWMKITIGEDWSGDDHDLRYFYYISSLGTLNVSASPIADSGLEVLCSLPRLHTLRLRVRGPGLLHLRKLPSLVFLSLKRSQLDAGVLAGLTGCNKLQSLGLDDTNVTDSDLAALPMLPELQDLWLNRTRISDDGLAHLSRFPRLKKLILTGITVKGPRLLQLAKIPTLEYLSLKHTRCDDSCMPSIGQLTQVTSLGLDDTPVTDTGMKHIERLATNLETLWLTNTDVSDRSVRHLKTLVNAKRMYLTGTHISPESLSELRAALPDCQVTFEQSKSK